MKIKHIRIVEARGNWANMLSEDRADYIATNMKTGLEAAARADIGRDMPAMEVVNKLKAADPDANGKNLQFIANMYVKKLFKFEDISRVKADIDKFFKSNKEINKALKEPGNEELAEKYPDGIKDLLQLKSLSDLYDLVDLAAGKEDMSGKELARQAMQGANKVIETENFKVYIPQTQDASCQLGKGTRWCTSGDQNNMFGHYHSQGPLYVIMAQIGGKLRKFQMHYESNQFKDEQDMDVKPGSNEIKQLSAMPGYTDFLNCMIVKHYGKYLPPEETKGVCKYKV